MLDELLLYVVVGAFAVLLTWILTWILTYRSLVKQVKKRGPLAVARPGDPCIVRIGEKGFSTATIRYVCGDDLVIDATFDLPVQYEEVDVKSSFEIFGWRCRAVIRREGRKGEDESRRFIVHLDH